MAEELKRLPPPFEILDLADGESIEMQIKKWELGLGIIVPRVIGVEKEIRILRVWVDPRYKLTVPYYWDITSGTLQAGLLPYLEKPNFTKLIFKITKYGVAPRARFTLEVRPKEKT